MVGWCGCGEGALRVVDGLHAVVHDGGVGLLAGVGAVEVGLAEGEGRGLVCLAVGREGAAAEAVGG